MYSSKCYVRKITGILLTILLTLLSAVPAAAAVPAPTPQFYVNDFSDLLSRESKDYIVQVNQTIEALTGAQVVVVTMDTLGGESLEEFATDLFRSYGIGDKQQNNGILFLVVTGDRDLRIEVGYGLEGAINDAKAGRILDDYVIPYLAENNWDEGIVNGFNALVEEVKKEYASVFENQSAGNQVPVRYVPEKQSTESVDWGRALVYAIVLSLIVGAFNGKAFPEQAALLNIPYWLGMTLLFFVLYDLWAAISALICFGVATLFGWAATSPDDGSSGYGGSGGSYSSHSGSHYSSSGRSSSGGGRSYSGGGGRSGGGGASRKF